MRKFLKSISIYLEMLFIVIGQCPVHKTLQSVDKISTVGIEN